MENKVKFEASVEYDDNVELAIEGTVSTTEKVGLIELIKTIRDEVLPEFNQGERKFTKEEIKVKIIK
jgi:hypothetical protein